MRKGLFAKLLAGAMLAAAAASASAQSFPSRPIRIIVAVTPGGGNDLADVRERFAGIGFESTPNSPAEMRQIMVAEIGKWAKVIKTAGIQPQ
ncbi:MAG: hypothetical protein HYY28_16785 [Betaproteobacteria bacterium]|nr:hypothetical protein [Betaproteobacteria bacterium]